MPRSRLLLATLAAYLPSAALPVLASRGDLPGGPLDPSLLVVPFCLAFAAAFAPWGRLADRIPEQRVITAALALSALAGLAVAFAPTAAALAGARALQGAAAAGVPPAAQAALARASSERGTGRAMSPMMLSVAVAVLGGPALAPLLAGAAGWSVAALVLSSVLPAVCLGLGLRSSGVRCSSRMLRSSGVRRSSGMLRSSDSWRSSAGGARQRRFARPRSVARPLAPYENPSGVRAGWIVSACVLGGHWTVLTRLTEALGTHGLHAGSGWSGAAPLAGAAGLPLVVLAARASDRVGPRQPMVATLIAGALGFGLAATASSVGMFVAASGVGLAAYWAYLPVVAAQVQRSAGIAARGRAAGGLYASMWAAAAVAGAAASLAPSWRYVLAGAGASWALAATVAARRFIVERRGVTAPAGVAPA